MTDCHRRLGHDAGGRGVARSTSALTFILSGVLINLNLDRPACR
jgi:hypothetical protein